MTEYIGVDSSIYNSQADTALYKVKESTENSRKTRKKKYESELDRINAIRLTKRVSKRKQRALAKINQKKAEFINVQPAFNEQLKIDLCKDLTLYKFNRSITLTHADRVTLSNHEKAVNRLIQRLVYNEFITNFFVVHEYEGSNYHTHILTQTTDKALNIRSFIKLIWKKGYSAIDDIEDLHDKINTINYCVNLLHPQNSNIKVSALADLWKMNLAEPENFYKGPPLQVPIIDITDTTQADDANVSRRKKLLTLLRNEVSNYKH